MPERSLSEHLNEIAEDVVGVDQLVTKRPGAFARLDRRRTRRRRLLSGVSVLLLAGAGTLIVHQTTQGAHPVRTGGDPSSTSVSSTSVTSTTTPGTPTTSGHHHVAETAESRALAAKLPSAVTGYVRQLESYGDGGPADLSKAIDDARDESERKQLLADHFVVGYQRSFLTPETERRVDYVIYQFADAAGASDFKELKARQEYERLRWSKDWDSMIGSAVPGFPNSEFKGESDTLQFHEIMFAKGNVWMTIRTYYFRTIHSHDPHGATGHLSAMEIATQQYARL
jgi:hypothetical protein